MNEVLSFVLPSAAGVLLGAFFYGGLWWTIRKGVLSELPALWFMGSLVARMSVTLLGFYFATGGHWRRILVCFLGFALARIAVTRLTAKFGANKIYPDQEVSHAS
jgi:F1F0 ATPase subunit 2